MVVGDGESETGPLATSWHSNKFLNPIRDGAVLPILHLNGYKINNPTLLARIRHEELETCLRGYGWTPYFVEGSDPESMHQAMAATLEHASLEIRRIQAEAARPARPSRPRWPMIVLRSPKGWTGPKEVDGHKVEGFWRAHQVPLGGCRDNPEHLKQLEDWLRSYKPEELVRRGRPLSPELKALAPKGTRRMSANPHANGGLLRKALRMPDFRDYAVDGGEAGHKPRPRTPVRWANSCATSCGQHAQLPRVRPGRKRVQQARCTCMRSARKPGWPSTLPRTPTAANCRPTAA